MDSPCDGRAHHMRRLSFHKRPGIGLRRHRRRRRCRRRCESPRAPRLRKRSSDVRTRKPLVCVR